MLLLDRPLPARAAPWQLRQRHRCLLPCRCQAGVPESELPAAPVAQPQTAPALSRRAALAGLAAAPAAAAAAAAVGMVVPGPAAAAAPAAAADALTVEQLFPGASQGALDTEGELRFTHRVFLDVGVCAGGARQDRKLGDKTVLCTDPEPLGRIIIGLYGTVAPQTVSNFVGAVEAGAYSGTMFNKVLPGQFVAAGRQGTHRLGFVEAPPLPPNSDILSSAAFQLRHLRPGTVSLNLVGNEDEEYLRLDKDYRNLSFLITTGPGPVPSLDGENIVFGQVIEGLDVVASIAGVPTFQPSDRLRAFNDFAKLLGDDRAAKARSNWAKPITPVVITAAGVLPA